jgi:hypothetical protein
MKLDEMYEDTNLINHVLDLQDNREGILLPNGVYKDGLEFDTWPEASEAHYAKTLYQCIVEVFGMDNELDVTVGTMSEATFAVHRSLILKHEKVIFFTLHGKSYC